MLVRRRLGTVQLVDMASPKIQGDPDREMVLDSPDPRCTVLMGVSHHENHDRVVLLLLPVHSAMAAEFGPATRPTEPP